MIYGFNYIVYIDDFIFCPYGIGFKNISGLFPSKAASFHMIGIIGQLYLCLMINTAGIFARFFFLQNIR